MVCGVVVLRCMAWWCYGVVVSRCVVWRCVCDMVCGVVMLI